MGRIKTLTDITVKILHKLDDILKENKPDIMLVHGDTTTTFAAVLSVFYNQVRIGQWEAGLRDLE